MIRKEMNLREERDFGEKFNAVFTFLQINFKSFIKVILLTAGPLILLGGIFFGTFYSKIVNMTFLGTISDNYLLSNFMEIGISYFFLGLAAIWLTIAVYAFMAEYLAGNRNITIEAVWNRGKGKILPVIGFGLLVGIAAMMVTAFFVVIPGGTGSMIIRVLLIVVLLMYIFITLSLVIPNMVIENDGLFESIGRSFSLIKGKWWSTFGLMMVIGIIANIATMIFAIPFYAALVLSVFMQTGDLGNIFTIISSCILFLGSFLMSTLPLLALGFQYFNLVERKEGTGLLEKIDQLGKPANPANEGDY